MIFNTFISDYEEKISEENRILIANFFIMFSRFEYALKTTTFARNSNGRVVANWESFVASIRNDFDKEKNANIKSAVDFLLDYPPKTQQLLDNNLCFQDDELQDNVPEINKLDVYIRRIRNNLFHGGKIYGYFDDGLRNPQLLKFAMIILEEWLELSEGVKNQFLKKLE